MYVMNAVYADQIVQAHNLNEVNTIFFNPKILYRLLPVVK